MAKLYEQASLWRISNGELLAVGDSQGPRDLFTRQWEMGQAGDKDTACTSLKYIEECGFDSEKFVDPEEREYRMAARETLNGGRAPS
jgi:hypothetical protein